MPARAPVFWRHKQSWQAQALRPLGWTYGRITAARMGTGGTRAPLPVVCVGNFVAGGAGKTPAAIAIAKLAIDEGLRPAFLTRGYGGALKGPVVVDPARHTAHDVGDEALLLSFHAPTIVAADRAAGAAIVPAQKHDLIIMDDGMQNPALYKDFTVAVVDGTQGIGNGYCLPAGPLRAPLARQMAAVDRVLVAGPAPGAPADDIVAAARENNVTIACGHFVQTLADDLLHGPVVAFAGIGRPEKFFQQLRDNGVQLVETLSYGDHHMYTSADAQRLLALAASRSARLVSTEKDRVRLHGKSGPLARLAQSTRAIPVSLVLDDAPAWRARLLELCRNRSVARPGKNQPPSTIRLKHRLEYGALRVAGFLLQKMSVDTASATMGRLWRLIAPHTYRHKRALGHLRRAMPALDEAQAQAIIRAMWDNLGRVFGESFHLKTLVADDTRIDYDKALVRALVRRPAGLICVSLHSGNWELAVAPFQREGANAMGLYKRAMNPLSDTYIRGLRGFLYPAGLHPRGHTSVASIMRHVRDGGGAGVLADLRDENGHDVCFFGHAAASTTFPAIIARRLDLPVIAVRCVRLAGAHFRIDIKPLDMEKSDDRRADIEAATRRIQAVFETWITEAPSQWMWINRRWNDPVQ